jgi:hypothetical protein
VNSSNRSLPAYKLFPFAAVKCSQRQNFNPENVEEIFVSNFGG